MWVFYVLQAGSGTCKSHTGLAGLRLTDVLNSEDCVGHWQPGALRSWAPQGTRQYSSLSGYPMHRTLLN